MTSSVAMGSGFGEWLVMAVLLAPALFIVVMIIVWKKPIPLDVGKEAGKLALSCGGILATFAVLFLVGYLALYVSFLVVPVGVERDLASGGDWSGPNISVSLFLLRLLRLAVVVVEFALLGAIVWWIRRASGRITKG